MTEIFKRRPVRALAAAVAVGTALPLMVASAAIASPAASTAKHTKYETGNLLVAKTGTWVKRNAAGASQGNALVTDGKKKQTLSLTFVGSSLSVHYCSGPLDGFFSVYVDGKLIDNINSYQPFSSCSKALFVNDLATTTPHRLVVQASAKRGSKHGTSLVAIDYFTTG